MPFGRLRLNMFIPVEKVEALTHPVSIGNRLGGAATPPLWLWRLPFSQKPKRFSNGLARSATRPLWSRRIKSGNPQPWLLGNRGRRSAASPIPQNAARHLTSAHVPALVASKKNSREFEQKKSNRKKGVLPKSKSGERYACDGGLGFSAGVFSQRKVPGGPGAAGRSGLRLRSPSTECITVGLQWIAVELIA
jgi:hypothetical protein